PFICDFQDDDVKGGCSVTGVQKCALPLCSRRSTRARLRRPGARAPRLRPTSRPRALAYTEADRVGTARDGFWMAEAARRARADRSEERRGGKYRRGMWWTDYAAALAASAC